MPGRLQDKVAIVTGAGSSGPGWGNGKATAVLFAREGAHVVAVDLRREAVEETVGIIRGEGHRGEAHVADVTQASDVARVVSACIAAHGRIDVLHNNVGIVELGGGAAASEESWDRVVDVNLTSMFLTCKAVLPHMERQGKGAIVNISSVSGIRWLGVPYVSYAATKAGILGLTRSIALEYAKKGVRANAILPGLMNTPMIVKPLTIAYGGSFEAMLAARSAQCPTGKMGDAWDVAYAALYLASDEAKYVTGAQLVVDGGLSCKVV
ncbi:MAG TPA: SDR family NAD(P)-dependent oxidoreductase [Candidatus Binatia bacterium]|nr:SDR family NAD(P)-dependent oxidoreductase [Candidatus Binatia bacterium]